MKDFKDHFNLLLNPEQIPLPELCEYGDSPNIPLLDDLFNMGELVTALKSVNANKAADLSGNSPGIYRHLPIDWLLFILNVLT